MLSPSLADAGSVANTRIDMLRRCVAAHAERLDFSGAILISRDGQTMTYARGEMRPGGAPITIGSRFNIGSAGKMFTAVAVGQLVDTGEVELDAPIGRYVDGLTPGASVVTVRQLLTHSSGLGNFFTPDNLVAIERARDLDALKPLISAEAPAFTPGSRFAYSNSGFLLLGLMIERVSGQTYGAYLASHVFAPAGMTATSLDPDNGAALAQGMTGMRPPPPGGMAPPQAGGPPRTMGPGPDAGPGNLPPPRDGGRPPPPGGPRPDSELRLAREAVLPGSPAGGAFSTVGDLQRFFVALQSGRLVKAGTARLLREKQIVSGPARGSLSELGYGLGFGTSSFEGHNWFGHNGGAPGLNAEAVVFPEDGVTVFVLANRDPPMASELLRAARATIFAGKCPDVRP
ncbi:MAG: serine hydrolase [Candidatus Sphingomonas phytovorans]|nr:serine hydrolase domain-containing protein [Sphingomonas sp.]WEJ98130.1 MAG: serine hydrolase [Sphingomonas sp.]